MSITHNPKAFISYSWTSPEHEEWVLNLATELRESGVDAILDKWDLREGHDANAFMERMVTDDEITKVILVCDRVYAEKADRRAGGVGTETQIVSGEVYSKVNQDKFVAIVTERDEAGKAYVPTYYQSRIYIDLSSDETYARNFENLLRWIFNKPLHEKPEIGSRPHFLEENISMSLGTASLARRVRDGYRNSRPYAQGAFSEYIDTATKNFERFRISDNGQSDQFDERVLESITSFLPVRNELIEIFALLAQYDNSDEHIGGVLHRLFESLIPYLNRPAGERRYREGDYDNYRFIVHELFLYALAVLIKHGRFQSASYLLEQGYYVDQGSDYRTGIMENYTIFCPGLRSLEVRNNRLKLNRSSLHADLLKERNTGTGIDFRDIMQADFICYLRDIIRSKGPVDFDTWWPITLVYWSRYVGPSELFARARSRKYFEQVKGLIGISSKEDLSPVINAIETGKLKPPQWGMARLNLKSFVAFDELGTSV